MTPEPHNPLAPILAEMREAFESIKLNDTTRYQHHERRLSDGKTPREAGKSGTRWATPREIAEDALKRLAADKTAK